MKRFYLSAFLGDLALGAVLLSIPLLLIFKFDSSSLTLGFFGAVGSLAYSTGVIRIGMLTDRIDRKSVIISGCLVFVAVYAVLPFVPSKWPILALYALGAFSMSMFWPTLQSWLSQGLDKKGLVNSLMYFNIFWSLGITLGFLAAGFLFAFAFWAPFVFGIILMAANIWFLRHQPVVSEYSEGAARAAFLRTEKERPPEAPKFLYIAWTANFMSWYIIGTARNIFPKLAAEIGFESGFIGFLIFLMMFAQTAAFFVLGKTHAWHYRFWPVLLCQAVSMAGLFMIFSFSTAPALMAAMVMLGVSSGMTYFSSIFYSLFGFLDKGRRSGIHEAFVGIGAFLGPLTGGLAAHFVGLRAPYIIAMAFLLIAIIIEGSIFLRCPHGA